MSIIKLEPGQKIIFDVANIETVEGNFGPQLKFTETRGDVMFLNVDAAERQLSRIGMNATTVVGQTIEFERITKDGKKFTNINKPGAAKLAAAPKANAKQELSSGPHIAGLDAPPHYSDKDAPPDAAADVESGSVYPKIQKLFDVYSLCWDHAHSLAKKTYGNDEMPDATASMAATLLIAAKDAGVTR